jgi:hypothetical protein
MLFLWIGGERVLLWCKKEERRAKKNGALCYALEKKASQNQPFSSKLAQNTKHCAHTHNTTTSRHQFKRS